MAGFVKGKELTITGVEVFGELRSRTQSLESDMKSSREDITEIKEDIKLIRENHLAHIQAAIEGINRDISQIKISMASLDPQNKLINKIIEYVILAFIASLVGIVFMRYQI